jgi:hypothetical protein
MSNFGTLVDAGLLWLEYWRAFGALWAVFILGSYIERPVVFGAGNLGNRIDLLLFSL